MVLVSSARFFDEDEMDERLRITHVADIARDIHIRGEAHRKGDVIYIVELERDGVPYHSRENVPLYFRRRLRDFLRGFRPDATVQYDL